VNYFTWQRLPEVLSVPIAAGMIFHSDSDCQQFFSFFTLLPVCLVSKKTTVLDSRWMFSQTFRRIPDHPGPGWRQVKPVLTEEPS
jgi:hypothetical protein